MPDGIERPFMSSRGTTVRSFSAPTDLSSALDEYAYDVHARSVSSVIAQAVEEFLRRKGYWKKESNEV